MRSGWNSSLMNKRTKGGEMQISIIAVGRIKEDYLKKAIAEYLKRLTVSAKVNIKEVADEKIPANASPAQEEEVRDKECRKILSTLPDNAHHIALDLGGENLSSEELAALIENLALAGKSHLVFTIGGSLGLNEEIKKKADYRLSFGRMTFPHQLMRVILLEQIYRAFKIIKGETYHK